MPEITKEYDYIYKDMHIGNQYITLTTEKNH